MNQSQAKMTEDDYERKFQEDLAKATALSLEALALDEFKKKRRAHYSFHSSVENSSFRNNNVQIETRPPPLPQRKEKTETEPDLISFTANVEVPVVKKETPEIEKKIENIKKLSSQTSTPPPQGSLQLVPYNNQANRVVPLTPSSLSSLYQQNTNTFNTPNPNLGQFNYFYNNFQHDNIQRFPTIPSVSSEIHMQSSIPNYSNQTFFHPQYANPYYNQYQPKVEEATNAIEPLPKPQPQPQPQLQTQPQPQPQPQSQSAPPTNHYLSMTKAPSVSAKSDTSTVPSIPGPSSGLRKVSSTKKTDDLIDLDVEDNSPTNILESFDPLNTTYRTSREDAENSFYSDYDPFEYIYSGNTTYSDPVYDAVIKNDISSPKQSPDFEPIYQATTTFPTNIDQNEPPPLPPRNTDASSSKNAIYDSFTPGQSSMKLYENVIMTKNYDKELIAFYSMVKELRAEYKYDDEHSNVGHVVAAEFDNSYFATSIKLLVYPSLECLGKNKEPKNRSSSEYGKLIDYSTPIVFTCNVNSTVEHVIMHVLCELEGQISGSAENFALKTIGSQEWLSSKSELSKLECVHTSIKMEKDVQLGLFPKTEKFMKALARTKQDDIRDAEIKLEDILPKEPTSAISYDNLMILLETLETEIEKLEGSAIYGNMHCSGVIQAVKAICALLGSLDTIEIYEAINNLKEFCTNGPNVYNIKSNSAQIYPKAALNIISENGDYAEVSLRPRKPSENIKFYCNQVRESIQHLLQMYAQAFHVNFSVKIQQWNTAPISITNVSQTIMVHVIALHRPPANWKHDEYQLGIQIYHGTRFLGEPVITQCSSNTDGLYPRLTFNTWLNFESVAVCQLPRESRLIFVLYGVTKEPLENQNADNSGDAQQNQITKVELGWSAVQFFDFEKRMVQGTYFLSLWPKSSDKYFTPAPSRHTHPYGDYCPVLSVEIPSYGGQLIFPDEVKNVPKAAVLDFASLDTNLQEELNDTIEQGSTLIDKREVLWEKRHYLQSFPKALPKVLAAAHSWDYACLSDLHSLLKSWSPMKPLAALELLLPRYPDIAVRAQAVKWISKMSKDDLVDYLPQLLQALKHDTYEASKLSGFLLGRALDSVRVAHYLYWSLVHSLPGEAPQNTMENTLSFDDSYILQARYHRRSQLMLRALLAICGEKLSSRFLAQNVMCKALADVAKSVKVAKENLRLTILKQNIENVNQMLNERPTSLPLDPGLEVTGISRQTCNYFNSNTLPLKINFLGPDNLLIPAIFKCGDDLQQDMLTLQMVRVMDKMWLSEGLDLKMVFFQCIPTGDKKGMIEMITNAETLRKIQVEWGLTGSFKDKPIAEWLAKQNPSQLEYQRAVDNFTASCAGYCVVTYILGICDRHNDNIMLKTSGHLFHIDFGKFLGDAQMFGNFKRDRAPFVLTSDMAYVINGGERPSSKFHNFVDLCCRAFNIVRKQSDLMLHMFALMATSGIPGVTSEAVNYVRNALLPGRSNPEASAFFAKQIQDSLKSWFTQFNFFLHNLAQMRFSGESQEGELLLSFVPKTYNADQDGPIRYIEVVGNQKRYDMEKYYTYILKVFRDNQPDHCYLFRTFKEFCELHQKLCLKFPLARFHSLQGGIQVGRSNIKTVADKRQPDIERFIKSLLNSQTEILNSDLVCTFFHPLLRDQQDADIHVKKVKEVKQLPPTNICGGIKFSFQYHRDTLIVMIHHARDLPSTTAGQEPNSYVKVYLKPDQSKITKRKTRLIKKNCYPSFMETLEYRMPLEVIRKRTLQVTVWNHDSLQENEFLGGIELPLSEFNLKEECVKWYHLGYLPRS